MAKAEICKYKYQTAPQILRREERDMLIAIVTVKGLAIIIIITTSTITTITTTITTTTTTTTTTK
jgi:hypothetical protein